MKTFLIRSRIFFILFSSLILFISQCTTTSIEPSMRERILKEEIAAYEEKETVKEIDNSEPASTEKAVISNLSKEESTVRPKEEEGLKSPGASKSGMDTAVSQEVHMPVSTVKVDEAQSGKDTAGPGVLVKKETDVRPFREKPSPMGVNTDKVNPEVSLKKDNPGTPYPTPHPPGEKEKDPSLAGLFESLGIPYPENRPHTGEDLKAPGFSNPPRNIEYKKRYRGYRDIITKKEKIIEELKEAKAELELLKAKKDEKVKSVIKEFDSQIEKEISEKTEKEKELARIEEGIKALQKELSLIKEDLKKKEDYIDYLRKQKRKSEEEYREFLRKLDSLTSTIGGFK